MSKYLSLSLIIVALILGVVIGFGVSQSLSSTPTAESKLSMQDEKREMITGPYTDQEFVSEMIIHHEDAVRMAKQVLLHTSRKEVQTMANDIIKVQSKEIETMKAWLMQWQ